MSRPFFAHAQMSAEDATKCVAKFEEAFWGTSFKFRPLFETSPEHIQRYRVSISKDGQYSNVFWDFDAAKIKSESCSLSNGQLITAFTQVGGANTSLRGSLDTEFGAISTVNFAPYLVGISQDDGLRFSEILRDKKSTVSVQPSDVDGVPCAKLVAQNSTFGEYCFWISESDNERNIQKITIKKVTGHRLVEGPYHSISKIGDVPRAGVSEDKQKQKELVAEAEKSPREVSREKTLFPIVYSKGLPQKMGLRYRSEYQKKDGENSLEGFCTLEVDSVRSFDHSSLDQAEFQDLSVEEGASVAVMGKEGIAYAFKNGKIERVIDTDSIGRADGIRFRKSKSNWTYYAACFVGMSAFVLLFMYLRQRVRK
jgi:hypothetical protein